MKKMTNKKGFTLMEMLIVVAIIAILVAIAIPTFSSSLKKANIATDKANVRAWCAEQVIANMMDGEGLTTGTIGSSDVTLKLTGATLKADLTDGVWTVTYDAGTGNANDNLVWTHEVNTMN